jgi:hypothetical protein
MARSSECKEQYAQKVLDTADIVRDAWFRKLSRLLSRPGFSIVWIISGLSQAITCVVLRADVRPYRWPCRN